jgi:hypothetical protein
LSTSIIFDFLSPKFAHLDKKELSKYKLGLKRVSNTDNKELEEALAVWQLRYDKHSDSGLITGDLLILKAREF